MITRRSFVIALGSYAATPYALHAQQAGRIPRIGVLWHDASAEAEGVFFKALIEGFQALGYVDGRNVKFEHRFANEKPELFTSMAAELVALKVDILVGIATSAGQAVKSATMTIPTIFALTADPVRTKLVESLRRPGGNMTGLSTITIDLAGKRLQHLKDVVPRLSRVALLGVPNSESTAAYFDEAKAVAPKLGITLRTFEVSSINDISGAFEVMPQAGIQAVATAGESLFYKTREHIAKMALIKRLPFCANYKQGADAGAFISYGVDLVAIVHRVGYLADRILKGEKPAEMAVEQPTVFDFVVNLRTAKALGIKIPEGILVQATAVID